MNVILKNVRLAFPKIFKAEQFQGTGETAFSASFLIDPQSQAIQVREIESAMAAVAKEKWGAKGDATLKLLKNSDKTCLHDGNDKVDTAGYENMLYIAARSKKKPVIRDRDAKTDLTAEDGRPYGGCYVNAVVQLWAQDTGFGKRINAKLEGLQFVKDGDAFSGSAPIDGSEFEALDDFGGADTSLI